MKAIVQHRFGSPDVLQFVDVDQPAIGPDDVLVRVHAAAINPYDWHMLRGDPYVARLMGGVGLTRPKHRIAGADGAGVVEHVGANVRDLRPGDEVLGWFEGSFAEYARAAADRVVRKPARLTFEQAAAVPMAGETALRAIRDVGRGAGRPPGAGQRRRGRRRQLRRPDRRGAGRRGHRGVQHPQRRARPVARRRARRRLHRRRLHRRARSSYDVVLDNVGNQPLRRLRRALTPTGTLVYNAGGSPGHLFGPIGSILRVVAVNGFVRQRLRPLPSDWTREHLLAVTELVEAGQRHPGRRPDVPAGRHRRRPAPRRAGPRPRQGRRHGALSRLVRDSHPHATGQERRPMITVTALTKKYGDRLAVDDLTFDGGRRPRHRVRRPERGRQVDHHADDGRAHPARPRRRPLRRRSTTGTSGTRPGPSARSSTPGACTRAAPPGTTCGPPPPSAASRPAGSTRSWPRSGSSRPPTSGPARSPSACASAWPWRRRCWATRRCCCSTSRPTASTRTASAGCATTSATSPRRGRHGLRVQPPHQRAQHVRRRPRRHRGRAAAGRRVGRGDHRAQRRRRARRDASAGRAPRALSPRTASPSRSRPTG